MTFIQYTPNSSNDILRLVLFAYELEPDYGEQVSDTIEDGIKILNRHPKIGRLVLNTNHRELVISYGKSGYIALYRYDELRNIVTVLAVRHQRELEFPAE